MVAALQTPAGRGKRLGLGIPPTGTTSERLAAIVAADAARWRAIVKATGLSVEWHRHTRSSRVLCLPQT
jgi:tripartite-type tricarboxylate transporter receptor subunit TctC